MTRRKKLAAFVLGGLGFLLILLMVAALAVPRLVNLTPLRTQFVTQLSQQLGAAIDLQNIELSLLPPHLVLEGVSVSIPGSVEATIQSLSIYPRLLAVIGGQPRVYKLEIIAPAVRVQLPQEAGDAGGAHSARVREAVASVFAAVSWLANAEAPGLRATVKDAQVRLATDGHEFLLTHIDGQGHVLPNPNRLSLDLSCGSDLWDRLALNVALDTSTSDVKGNIDVTGVRPAGAAYFLPQGAPQFGNAAVNLGVRFATHGLEVVQAEVDASTPALPVQRGDDHRVIQNANLKATVRVDQHTVKAAVSELDLGYPRLRLSGSLSLDDVTPRATLELEATDLDVTAVRDVGLLLAGNSAVTQDIFDILHGGHVPQFSLHSEAPAVAGLGGPDALVIRGRLVDGRVTVAGLDLEDVTGLATVAHDVLVGEQLSGRLGNSQANDGKLRVGLSGAAPELYLNTMVDADAAALPPLLKRLIANPAFSRELERISEVEGTASGKLILGGTTKDVTVTTEVSPFKVSGRLRGLGQPLQVEGGRFLYTNRGVEAMDLQVSTPASTVSQFSLRVDWSREPASLQASCGTSRVALDEVYPWLVASGWVGDSPSTPKVVSGTVSVESLLVHGPADRPDDWRFELIGAAQNLEIDAPLLREHIAIRYPVALSKLRLARQETAGLSLSGQVAAPDGLTGSVDLVWNPQELNIKRLSIHDAQSDASLSLRSKAREVFLTFAGSLTKGTLDKLLLSHHVLNGWVRGDFRTRILSDQPGRSTAEGKLEASEVFLPLRGDTAVQIHTLSLNAVASTVNVDAAIEAGADSRVHLHGGVTVSPRAFTADLDLSAGALDWESVATLLLPDRNDRDVPAASAQPLPLRGRLRVAADSFTYAGFTWRPLHALVTFAAGGPTVDITQATVCGIATPAKITAALPEVGLTVRPVATSQQLEPALTCLLNEHQLVTGLFNLAGEVTGRGRPTELGRSLHGRVALDAKHGSVYRLKVMAGVFTVLSVATGAVWNLPDLTTDGLPYDTISVRGSVRDGQLVVNQAVMDGPTMKMVAEGSIDLLGQTADLTLLVAPLKTVDAVVSRIPVIGRILGGSLVTIPVKVSGKLVDPQVTPLPAGRIGSELLGLMKKTVRLPVQVIDAMLPAGQQ